MRYGNASVQNVVAIAESQTMTNRSDWQLNPVIFGTIAEVCVTSDGSVPSLFQLATRSLCGGNRCLLQDWSQTKGYANPPWNLIGRVLSKAQMNQAHIILVAPVWKTQPWCLLLLLINCSSTSDQPPSDNVRQRPEGLVHPCGLSQGEIPRPRAFGGSYLTHTQVLED